MKDFVKNLEQKKIYILSPHLDDAILSCGQLLSELSGRADITVINVFTKAHSGPYTLSGKKLLSLSGGYNDASQLYEERVKEDKKALTSLGVKIINLDLEDALFRRKVSGKNRLIPELTHVYPTYRWNVIKNKIAFSDTALEMLETKLIEIVPDDALIFSPYTVSNHVDHFIVRTASDNLYKDVIYYSEFPYNISKNNYGSATGYETLIVPIDPSKKRRLIALYKTQLLPLFPSGKIPMHKEVYFLRKKTDSETKIYTRLTAKVEKEWRELWLASNSSNFVNSPEWFLSVVQSLRYKNYVIVAVYRAMKLVAVTALLCEKKYGVEKYAAMPEDFLCGSAILGEASDKKIMNELLGAILTLGVVTMNNIPEDVASVLLKTSDHVSLIPISKNYYYSIQKDNQGNVVIKNRNKVLKRIRGMESEFTIKRFDGTSNDIWKTVYEIDMKSAKKDKGYNVFSDGLYKKFYVALANNFRKNLCIHILYYKDIPIIYEIGFLSKNTYFGSQMAYVSEFAKFSPGKVLLVKLIEVLSENKGIEIINFGSGTNAFKQSFTDLYTPLYDAIISKSKPSRIYLKSFYSTRISLFTLMQKHVTLYAFYRRMRNAL